VYIVLKSRAGCGQRSPYSEYEGDLQAAAVMILVLDREEVQISTCMEYTVVWGLLHAGYMIQPHALGYQ
jgi:hypothetical protein